MGEFVHGILIHLHDVDPWQMTYWMLLGALFHSVLRTPIARARRGMDLGEDSHDGSDGGEVRTSHDDSITNGNIRRDTRRRHV